MDAVLGTKSLSAAQKGILLRHTLHSNQSFLNVGGYAFVKGSLDLDRLAYAIRFVLDRADVLALLSAADVMPSAMEYDVTSNVIVLGTEAACKEWMEKDIKVPIVEQQLIFCASVLQCGPDTFFWYVKTHHILFDGYAMALFFNKVSDIYNNHSEDPDAGLKSFNSFIQQEHAYEQSPAFQSDRRFWAEKVKDIPDGNMFLSLANLGGNKTLTSIRKEQIFSRENFNQLEEFCNKHNVTIAHLFIAVLLFLNRSLNNATGVVGIPVFNRPDSDARQTLGACMNVIPLFLDIAHIETFTALVTAVRNELKSTVKHQRYELFNILELLKTDGSFFNVTFSHQKNTYNGKLGDADVAITFMHNGSQQEDLAVHLLEYSDTRPVVLAFDYRLDVFSEAQVKLLIDIFSEILDQALSAGVSLKDIAIVRGTEAGKLLDSFNRRPDQYTPAGNVLTQFAAWKETTPAAPAIVYRDIIYSYYDLNNIADAIGNWLKIEYGIKKGDRIGLKTDRTPISIAAILGILKAGAVYVPISPDYPEDRITYIVEDSNCKLLIDNDNLQQFDRATFTNRDNDNIVIADSDLAYIMYTSGSTGRPKGVMVTHGNVGAFVKSLPDSFGFEPGWRIASLTSLTFDISILELLGAVCNGLSIVLMEAEDPVMVSSRFSAGEVDVLQLTPSRLQQLLNGGMDAQVLNPLKVLLVGGEALPPHLYALLRQQDARVYNVYGPTETTIWSSSLLLNDSETLSIGRPLSDEQLYILNAYGQLCPVGIPGEICIGGVGVARGYLNLEELTTEKFISDPFSGISGSRLYRTGDIGYWREDATIMYVGRRDQQVKVRGYRIELGEIESVLQQYEGISQCAVLATGDDTGNHQLVAYVVATGTFDKEGVQTWLRGHLPAYMVPGIFIPLDRLPLTTNGKLDRRALPPVSGLITSTREYVAPGNDTEQAIATIWEELLGIDKVSINDNFFELGGHSLLAARVMSRLRSALDIAVSIRDIFSYPVLAELSAYIIKAGAGVKLPAIVCEERPAHIPLSYSQKRLWFIDQLEGSIHYHIPAVLRVHGRLDVSRLERAFRQVLSRHEVLRSVMLEVEGTAYQQVLSDSGWSLGYRRLEGACQGSNHVAVQELLDRPFNLSSDYMLRADLQEYANEEQLLVVVLHHIAADGWSMPLLVQELVQLYKNIEDSLPGLRVQYADYALWERRHLNGPLLEEGLAYWQSQLSGAGLLELPSDRTRSASTGHAGSRCYSVLDGALLSGLEQLSSREGVTLYMTLLSAFKVLLYRYSGQTDISVGSPVANRSHHEIEKLIGFFVNTVVLRTELSGAESFLNLLGRVRQLTVDAYHYQHIPFEKVVGRQGLPADRSRHPLFQVMFAMQQEVVSAVELGDVTLEEERIDQVSSKFDLSMELRPLGTGPGYQITLTYNSGLYSDWRMQGLLTHYEQLLRSIVLSPGMAISSLGLLSASEINSLKGMSIGSLDSLSTGEVKGYNGNSVPYPVSETLVSLFQQQAVLQGALPALLYGDQQLSYRELDHASTQLAHYLRKRGVIRGSLVGLCLERSLEMVIGILGIQKAGGAYVPIDPSYPSDRISYIISDTSCRLIVSDGSLSATAGDYEVIDLLSLRSEISKEPVTDLPEGPQPSDLAYVIYTSGSTGRPKGVLVEHGGVVNYLCHQRAYLGIGEGERMLQLASYTFDASVEQIFLPLISGAVMVMIAGGVQQDLAQVSQLIREAEVTHLHATPGVLYQLGEQGPYPSLKRVLSGGERCPVSLVQLWNTGISFYNKYGPTEATITATIYRYEGDELTGSDLPIGRPVSNTHVYIVSEGQLCPVGIPGEICIGGVGVTRGYLNQGALTAEKFISDLFSGISGSRLYRTGDIGYWREDGTIMYVGRRDQQVKVRGYRIELGEIESVLQQYEAISQCAVLATGENSQLVAYVVATGTFDKDGLQTWLRSHLPAYMVPGIFIPLERLPLTKNGKLDRRALPPVSGLITSARAYVAPRNDTEHAIATIWQELLGIDKVSINDNFFELGGHSLLAARVISRLRSVLDIAVSIRDIFSYPVLAELSAYIIKTGAGVLLPAIVREELPAHIPLSYSQERLWFIDQLEGSVHYHIPAVLRVHGRLDVLRLEHAFRQVLSRHEVLRSVMLEIEGTAYQQVLSDSGWSLGYRRIEGACTGSSHVAVQELVDRPFNLSSDYMLRAELQEYANEEQLLVVVLHHIAADGWSMPLLVQELVQLYKNIEDRLPGLSVQYADYALWERRHLNGPLLEEGLAYWQSQLSGAGVLELPSDRARSASTGHAGSRCYSVLDGALLSGLEQLSSQEGVTLYMTLLSAFKVLLYRYSGQTDISVGSPVANRSHHEIEKLIGFFINTVVLRTQLTGEESFRSLLNRVRQLTVDAYHYQHIPFEKVVVQQGFSTNGSRNPLFQVMFVLQHESAQQQLVLSEDAVLSYGAVVSETSKFDLTLEVRVTDTGLKLGMEYNTGLFDAARIERMLCHYQELLKSIVTNRNCSISSLGLLTSTEEQTLLHAFNQVLIEYPRNTIVDLFSKQSQLQGEKTAVIFGDYELSYNLLDVRSSVVSRMLQDMGAGPGSVVPVCMERSPELVIALLGILKAGCAYVPIDPSYPSHRINHILEDTGAKMLISDEACYGIAASTGKPVLNISREDNSQLPQAITAASVSADSLAYIMYTSGSTGRPKGVMVTHGNVGAFVKSLPDSFGFEPGWRIASLTSLTFDISILELLGAVCNGLSIVLMEAEDPVMVSSRLSAGEVDVLQLTPSRLQQLLNGGMDAQVLNQLKVMLVGGEALPPYLYALLRQQDARVYNVYGPTETTIWSSSLLLNDSETLSIGRPLSDEQLYILNAYGQLCPVGIPGEICIGGVGVARGYLNLEELTAEKFIIDPFSGISGSRLYRTGDIGYWREDGTIMYVGRRDQQVKVRGYRIELGEIESVLQQYESISQCAVLATGDDTGSHQLVAYVVATGTFDKEGAQTWLRSHLPAYMVPGIFIPLDRLPLTTNGKLDRRALPPVSGLITSAREYVAPRNDTEHAIATIWEELLGIDKVSTNDNFFEFGGHSLLAARVMSRLRSALDIAVSIRDIFSYPVLAELSAYIIKAGAGGQLPAIVREERPAHIPLSYSQERLWFIDQLEGSIHYHIPAVLRVHGRLDVLLLERAFRQVLSRHEVLRSVMLEVEGTAYQQVLSDSGWSLGYRRLEGACQGSNHVAVQELLDRPFNLSSDYMLRAELQEYENEEQLLVVVLHHIAADGWSMPLLVQELVQLYKNIEDSPPGLSVQYADYALWERRQLNGPLLEEGLAYWQSQLSGAGVLELPSDRTRSASTGHAGSRCYSVLDGALLSGLEQLSSQEGVTLYMTLLSTFKVLLYRYSGQTDISVGSPVANRSHHEIEKLIGFFVNTVVLRTELSGAESFLNLLGRVRQLTVDAYHYQHIPFEKVVGRQGLPADRSRHPLFQVMFAMQQEVVSAVELGDVTLEEERIDQVSSKFDLSMELRPLGTGPGYQITLTYNSGLYSDWRMQGLLTHYEQLLRSILSSPGMTISSLELLSAEEMKRLKGYNGGSVPYPVSETLVSLFQQQAVLQGALPALLYGYQQLSYRELDHASTQLAHYLRKRGVIRGSLVGLCLERSLEMVIGILGIQKAGGAYVPIDPSYPSDRINYIISDTRCQLIVSDGSLSATAGDYEVIDLLSLRSEISKEPVTDLTEGPQPSDLAYVIYTSGSTGRPKGVLVEHGGVVNYLCHQRAYLGIGEGERMLQLASYTFDASVEQIFLPLISGAVMVMIAGGVQQDLAQVGQLIREAEVTHLHATPGVLYQLGEQGPCPSLKRVLSGGERCPMSLVQLWNTGISFYNKYGPTEATITATIYRYEGDELTGSDLPIGRPVSNTHVYIVSEGQLCPVGIPGEICIGGAGVTRGYLNQEALTAEKFIGDPFSGISGSRLYRTGDIGYWGEDGTIMYVGRRDQQVKVRGYRIELGEIESVLQQYEAISQCAVLATGDDTQLVAYVVATGTFDKDGLQTWLRSHLPAYMVPGIIIPLERLPLTKNGKLDRRALPPASGLITSARAYVAPRNDTEQALVTIWQELLGVEQVGVYDNFFELGGHSLMIMKFISKIKLEFGISMPVKYLYELTDIAGIAELIDMQLVNRHDNISEEYHEITI